MLEPTLNQTILLIGDNYGINIYIFLYWVYTKIMGNEYE